MVFYLAFAPGMYPGKILGHVVSIRDVPGGFAVSCLTADGVRSSVYMGEYPCFTLVCPD